MTRVGIEPERAVAPNHRALDEPRGTGPAASRFGRRTTGTRTAQRRKRKRWTGVLALLVLAGMSAAAAAWLQPWRAGGGTVAAPATAKVVRRDFASAVLATGAVQAQVGAEVRVGARISGKVDRLHANIGDAVAKGQVVAELEMADLQAVVAQRQAELELAQAKLTAVDSLLPKEIEKARLDLEESQANYTLAHKQLDRETLLRQKDANSPDDLDESEQQYAAAKARLAVSGKALELAETRYAEELRQAKAEEARAQSAHRHAQVQLSYATITAPIDGVIASVATEEGETVAAGMQAPTFVTIIDLDRLQVDAYVDEVDIGKVRVGQRATFTVDAFPAQEFEGRVAAIYPKAVIQENVVNYDVVVEIATPYRGLLRPEMTASVTILLDSRTDVLAIPAKAVQRERGKSVVYVSAGGPPEARELKVGWRDGAWIEVVSGLEEGQTVFLEPPRRQQELSE
ncbi:MAG: efflux RND transporter periplasmic adaptor subunit [Pirellulaceae bacterium]|jgi:multidrug efflux pump subunit AcrA (membrane-fusion protein)|nr:efflux RND transporter periplasmic adaptor subunit [Pirellulaceae bacterium]